MWYEMVCVEKYTDKISRNWLLLQLVPFGTMSAHVVKNKNTFMCSKFASLITISVLNYLLNAVFSSLVELCKRVIRHAWDHNLFPREEYLCFLANIWWRPEVTDIHVSFTHSWRTTNPVFINIFLFTLLVDSKKKSLPLHTCYVDILCAEYWICRKMNFALSILWFLSVRIIQHWWAFPTAFRYHSFQDLIMMTTQFFSNCCKSFTC
jgi:hypothetical protein